jgi:beta-1,4-mannosyl-glycoprotein beta-1,4-N-acetylglucosaminyltransferase
MNPKIYDCFCYFNEDMILELRLETLWDVVDVFVIAEATYTQAGEPKPINFLPERFAKYMSKIRHLVVDHKPQGPNDFWKNENYQRNYLKNGLTDAQPDDWVLVSDLDEIPRPETIVTYNPKYLRGDFEQDCYGYFLNNLWLGEGGSRFWPGSKVTTYRHFVGFFKSNATSVRIYKSSGLLRSLNRKLFKLFRTQKIKNGGWHFTWMFKIEDIIKKIESMAHQEYNKPEFKNPEYILKMIHNGRDFHKPKSRFQAQEINESFPRFLIDNQSRYQDWLLPPS